MNDERHEELTEEELAAVIGGCCCQRDRRPRGAPMANTDTETRKTVVVVTVERLVT